MHINSHYLKTNLIITLLFITFINNFFRISQAKESTPINNKSKKSLISKNNAFGISYGKFYNIQFSPYSIRNKEWTACSALTLCNLDKELHGNLYNINYSKKIFREKNFFIDYNLSVGEQSNKVKEDKQIKNNYTSYFTLISAVPTYRYFFPSDTKKFNLGIGTGLSMSIGKIPSEYNKSKVQTQVNLEFGYEVSEKLNTDIVLKLNHRCTLFGLIGGSYQGRQWVTVGLRRWI